MIALFFQRRKVEACTARGHEYDRRGVNMALCYGKGDATTVCSHCRSRLVFQQVGGMLTIPPWLL